MSPLHQRNRIVVEIALPLSARRATIGNGSADYVTWSSPATRKSS
jgi:hypothetical protein